MGVVRPGQLHQVRTVGDEPMTLYLSVTPHVDPTHTHWDEQGTKLPPRYGVATARERAAAEAREPVATLVARQVAAAKRLAEAAQVNAEAQATAAIALEQAGAAGDTAAAKAAVDAMAAPIDQLYRGVTALLGVWNERAPAATEG